MPVEVVAGRMVVEEEEVVVVGHNLHIVREVVVQEGIHLVMDRVLAAKDKEVVDMDLEEVRSRVEVNLQSLVSQRMILKGVTWGTDDFEEEVLHNNSLAVERRKT